MTEVSIVSLLKLVFRRECFLVQSAQNQCVNGIGKIRTHSFEVS